MAGFLAGRLKDQAVSSWAIPISLGGYTVLIPYGESNLAIFLVFFLISVAFVFRNSQSMWIERKEWLFISVALCMPLAISLLTAYRFDKTLISLTVFLTHAVAGLFLIHCIQKHDLSRAITISIALVVGIWTLSALPYQIRGLETSLVQQWIAHLTGNYGNFPNLGNVLAHLSPFYFEAIYRLAKKLNNRWPWLLAIPLILAVLMSDGRSGWIVLSLVLIFYTWRLVRTKHLSKSAVAIGIGLVCAAIAISSVTVPQVDRRIAQSVSIIDGGFQSIDRVTSGRWGIWSDTASLLPERIYYGHGAQGTGKLLVERGVRSREFGYEHLYWLEVAVSTGLIGLTLYLACFAYMAFLLIRRTDPYGYAFSPMLAAVCILLPLNVHWEFYSSRPASLMWFLLILAMAFYASESGKPTRR